MIKEIKIDDPDEFHMHVRALGSKIPIDYTDDGAGICVKKIVVTYTCEGIKATVQLYTAYPLVSPSS